MLLLAGTPALAFIILSCKNQLEGHAMKAVCHSHFMTLSVSYRQCVFYSGICVYLEKRSNFSFILSLRGPLNLSRNVPINIRWVLESGQLPVWDSRNLQKRNWANLQTKISGNYKIWIFSVIWISHIVPYFWSLLLSKLVM